MMTNWKSATCERCVYRVGIACHRFPPQRLHSIRSDFVQSFHPRYPLVIQSGHHDESKNGHFIEACAEYTEEGQPTPFERAAKLAIDKGAVAVMDAMTGSVRKPLTTYDVAEEAWK